MTRPGQELLQGRAALSSLWSSLLVHGALLSIVWSADDDRLAAGMATLSFLLVAADARVRLRLSPLSPAMVYLYVLGCFHLGLAAPWFLGVASDPLPSWFVQEKLSPALLLVMGALGSFHAGLAWSVWCSPERPSVSERPYHNRVMYAVGLAVIAVGVVSLGIGLRSLGLDRVSDASYFDIYRLTHTYDPRFFTTSLQVAPMGLYLAAASAPMHRLRWVYGLGGLWILGILLLGFRGYALVPAATTAAVLHKRGLRPPRWSYVAGGLALLMLVPAIKTARDGRLADRGLEDFLLPEHPFAALEEVGGSLRPLVHTLTLMENEDLRWGKTYAQAISMVVPNVSSEWAGAQYVPVEDLPPSHWVTRLASPWHYQNYGGLGFSAVAEPYMNFGPLGVGVIFFALAAALIWADRLDAARPLHIAMWAMALGPLLWTTRNTSGVFFRPALWGVIVVFAAWQLSRLIAQTRSLQTAARVSRNPIDGSTHLTRLA